MQTWFVSSTCHRYLAAKGPPGLKISLQIRDLFHSPVLVYVVGPEPLPPPLRSPILGRNLTGGRDELLDRRVDSLKFADEIPLVALLRRTPSAFGRSRQSRRRARTYIEATSIRRRRRLVSCDLSQAAIDNLDRLLDGIEFKLQTPFLNLPQFVVWDPLRLDHSFEDLAFIYSQAEYLRSPFRGSLKSCSALRQS